MRKCYKENGHGKCNGRDGKTTPLLEKCVICKYYVDFEEFEN